jgi:TonB family protein
MTLSGSRIRFPMMVGTADKHYFRADFNDTSEGVLLPKSFIATDLNGFFMSWTFVAGSEDELAQLAESVRRASFHEKEVPILSDAAAAPTDETKCPVTDEQPPTEHPLRVRISQGVSQAMLCKKLRPIYPEAARQKRIEGMVVMKAVISTTGTVRELKLISGDPALSAAALEAVKQWQYKPYSLNGKPVEVETQIKVAFQLGH